MLAAGPGAVWRAFGPLHERKLRDLHQMEKLEKGPIGDVNYTIERLRLAEKKLDIDRKIAPAERDRRKAGLEQEVAAAQKSYDRLAARLSQMRGSYQAETLVMKTAAGETKEMPVGTVVRAIRPNVMGSLAKLRLYGERGAEFVAGDPRESNTEGGSSRPSSAPC